MNPVRIIENAVTALCVLAMIAVALLLLGAWWA